MIVIPIELWPQGDQDQKRILGVITIVNDGTGSAGFGNYNVKLSHAGKYINKDGAYKTGVVKNHKRSLSPYHLLFKALSVCLGRK